MILIRVAVFCCLLAIVFSHGGSQSDRRRSEGQGRKGPVGSSSGGQVANRNPTRSGPGRRSQSTQNLGPRRDISKPRAPSGQSGPRLSQRRPPRPRQMISAMKRRVMLAFMRRRLRFLRRQRRMKMLINLYSRRFSLRRRSRGRRDDDDKDEDKKKRMTSFMSKVQVMIQARGGRRNKTRRNDETDERRRGRPALRRAFGRKGNKSSEESETSESGGKSRPALRRTFGRKGNKSDEYETSRNKTKPMSGKARDKMENRRYRQPLLRKALKVLLKWKGDDETDKEEKKSLEDLISKLQDILDEDDDDDDENADDDEVSTPDAATTSATSAAADTTPP